MEVLGRLVEGRGQAERCGQAEGGGDWRRRRDGERIVMNNRKK